MQFSEYHNKLTERFAKNEVSGSAHAGRNRVCECILLVVSRGRIVSYYVVVVRVCWVAGMCGAICEAW